MKWLFSSIFYAVSVLAFLFLGMLLLLQRHLRHLSDSAPSVMAVSLVLTAAALLFLLLGTACHKFKRWRKHFAINLLISSGMIIILCYQFWLIQLNPNLPQQVHKFFPYILRQDLIIGFISVGTILISSAALLYWERYSTRKTKARTAASI